MNDTKIRRGLIRAAHLGKLKIFDRILKKYPEHPLDNSLINALIIIADTTTNIRSILCLERILNSTNVNSVNVEGDTPLLTAVKFSGKHSITILVEAGADLEAKDKKGLTILDHAVRNFKLSIMAYLISKGAFITSKDTFTWTIKSMMYFFIEQNNNKSLNLRTIKYINVCWAALNKQHNIHMDALDKYEMKKLSFFAKCVSRQEEKTKICYKGCVIL